MLFPPVHGLDVVNILFTLIVMHFSPFLSKLLTLHEGGKEGGLLTCSDVYVLS